MCLKYSKWLFSFVLLLSTTNVFASSCEFDEVVFSVDFPTARLNECIEKNNSSYLLKVNAENYPVNHSPWYAFKVQANKAKKIRIAIAFKNEKPRYFPKISRDKKTWQAIPFKIRNNQLTFKLSLDKNPLFVAGQEIIDNEFYLYWLKNIEKLSGSKMSVLGQSTEERPIYQIQSSRSTSNEWIVLTGRMHPPEVTGALALFPFSQELLLGKGLASQFRERFNILLVPNLNPDGVELGHWRHNINGVDLNRDWKNFKQKETQLVHQKLQSIVKDGGKIVFGIDFHSTQKDVFYTMPTDYGMKPAMLVEEWLNDVAKKLPDFNVRVKPGSRPNKGIFKQYIADTYGVQAVTYETADEADRQQIQQVAKVAATTFMDHLLKTPKKDF
ncbi:MAG: hypothetical protein ACJAS9_001816 [Polaribacter sp.]|jgi:hypothetical protein